MSGELANYSIETDQTVLLTFKDGRTIRVGSDRLSDYLAGPDLITVQRAKRLREDFIHRHMPKAVFTLVASGALSLFVIGAQPLAQLVPRTNAPIEPAPLRSTVAESLEDNRNGSAAATATPSSSAPNPTPTPAAGSQPADTRPGNAKAKSKVAANKAPVATVASQTAQVPVLPIPNILPGLASPAPEPTPSPASPEPTPSPSPAPQGDVLGESDTAPDPLTP